MTAVVDLAVGQKWSLRDRRYDGWRYPVIEELTDEEVRARHRSGRRSTFRRDRFGKGARWMFCGYEGPGVLPAYSREPVAFGCLSCPPKPAVLALETWLAPGFGWTTVTRDGEPVWQTATESRKRLAHAELWARETPGDWRVRFDTAMSERLYQRQDAGWLLVSIGWGFA